MIQISLKKIASKKLYGPSRFSCQVFSVFENTLKDFSDQLMLDPFLVTIISRYIKEKRITGKLGELVHIPIHTAGESRSILVFGLGKREQKMCVDKLRQASGDLVRLLRKKRIFLAQLYLSVAIQSSWSEPLIVQAVFEGLLLGDYTLPSFKQKKDQKTKTIKVDILVSKVSLKLKESILNAKIMAKYISFGRDLVNLPPNFCYPKSVVERIQDEIKEHQHMTSELIDQKKAEALKMGAFLAVAQGSEKEPFMMRLSLNKKTNQKPIVLIGKGVTFDSGGISIKSSKGMMEMKADMAGAAVVVASLLCLSALNCSAYVEVFVPLVENMPSHKAYRPGDVIMAMNGSSIEVVNTDAEGRLILADAICFAHTLKPKVIIDVATLTGSAVMALGPKATALFGESTSLVKRFLNAAKHVPDTFWRMPLFEDYKDWLKSDMADIKNCPEGKPAGAITAALFLQSFVKKIPWLHLDIAATMEVAQTQGMRVKGFDVPCVHTLFKYVMEDQDI